MIILFTGSPGVGKSTLITKIVQSYSGRKFGIISNELRDKNENRVGFSAQTLSEDSNPILFAHIHDIDSKHIIGNKYKVSVSNIEKYLVPELKKGISYEDKKTPSLIVIDEIGRMQSLSDLFLHTVREVFHSKKAFIGTITLEDELWNQEFKTHSDVLLITITNSNRDIVGHLFPKIINQLDSLSQLSSSSQKTILSLSKKYVKNNHWIQLEKLFLNSILYIGQNKVSQISGSTFKVIGNTNTHLVNKIESQYTCDCPLFLGKHPYESSPGECSHIQAVKIFTNT